MESKVISLFLAIACIIALSVASYFLLSSDDYTPKLGINFIPGAAFFFLSIFSKLIGNQASELLSSVDPLTLMLSLIAGIIVLIGLFSGEARFDKANQFAASLLTFVAGLEVGKIRHSKSAQS